MTVCKLGEQELFEVIRREAAALKTRAELYTPEGAFVKITNSPTPELFNASGDAIHVQGATLSGNTFSGCRIGILIREDGSLGLCAGSSQALRLAAEYQSVSSRSNSPKIIHSC